VKGSVDVLLPRCTKVAGDDGVRGLTDDDKTKILAEADRMSARPCACSAAASQGSPSAPGEARRPRAASTSADEVERELTFLGLVGMMDPPRAGVKEAVATCASAGIRAVMITGDHRITATAIAKEIGLWDEGDEAITGSELALELGRRPQGRVMKLRVFARTTAEQKLRIVRAFKATGTSWP
jgi:Ca2+-transporting ATPase